MPADRVSRDAVPISASLLGWAGVLPFGAGASAAVLGLSSGPVPASAALVGYGAVILSFMGGAQWGLTARAPDGADRGWAGYVISVLPALLAWPCLFLPGRTACLALAAGFAALLAWDLATVRLGRAPGWYGRLRIQLTTAAILCLVAAAAFSPGE